MTSEQKEKEHWTLDKRVPLALIFSLVIQTGYFVWWARGLQEKNLQVESRVGILETGRKDDRVSERLAVIEYQLREQKDASVRIEAQLVALRGAAANGNGHSVNSPRLVPVR